MLKYKAGHLIAIGSRWGESGAKNASAYAASKSALRAFIRSLQLELKDTGIRPTLVSPGSVAGRMAAKVDIKSAKLATPGLDGIRHVLAGITWRRSLLRSKS